MAQKALSPKGGDAARLGVRLPLEEVDRLDRAAKRLGLGRSAFVRAALAAAIAHAESKEVARAS